MHTIDQLTVCLWFLSVILSFILPLGIGLVRTGIVLATTALSALYGTICEGAQQGTPNRGLSGSTPPGLADRAFWKMEGRITIELVCPTWQSGVVRQCHQLD